jgi:hypothetical protein
VGTPRQLNHHQIGDIMTMPTPLPPLPPAQSIVRTAATYARDVTERVLATFLATVAAMAIAAGPADMLHLGFWQMLGTGGLAAVVSLLKGIVARAVGDSNSASTFPGV